MPKRRLLRPIRFCTKKTGPGEVSLMSSAVKRKTGSSSKVIEAETAMSIRRLITTGQPSSLTVLCVMTESSSSNITTLRRETLASTSKRLEIKRTRIPCSSQIVAISEARECSERIGRATTTSSTTFDRRYGSNSSKLQASENPDCENSDKPGHS